MTRDRVLETAEWCGKRFEVVDTGGMLPGESELIVRQVYEQAKTAIERAGVVLFVVDSRVGVTPLDLELAKFLKEQSKSVFVVANKCDSLKSLAEAHQFYELGFEKVFPVSAEHGLNVGDLLDEVIGVFPLARPAEEPIQKETLVAIIGKPNVGKSTLLNTLLGEERAIVSPSPGTTRDAVDSLLIRNGKAYRFIDTAGIRKKSKTELMAEKLSVIMARKHLRRSDVALTMIDAAQGPTSLDATIAGYAQQAGVSVILVANKWDLVNKNTFTMQQHEASIRSKIKYLDYAPLIFISAKTGQRVGRLFELIDAIAEARRSRVTTGELNSFLQKVALQRAPVPFNEQVKVHYMTQVGVAPPTFALFTNRRAKLHFSLERYLINRIRERFGFQGTPIVIKQKRRMAG